MLGTHRGPNEMRRLDKLALQGTSKKPLSFDERQGYKHIYTIVSNQEGTVHDSQSESRYEDFERMKKSYASNTTTSIFGQVARGDSYCTVTITDHTRRSILKMNDDDMDSYDECKWWMSKGQKCAYCENGYLWYCETCNKAREMYNARKRHEFTMRAETLSERYS